MEKDEGKTNLNEITVEVSKLEDVDADAPKAKKKKHQEEKVEVRADEDDGKIKSPENNKAN